MTFDLHHTNQVTEFPEMIYWFWFWKLFVKMVVFAWEMISTFSSKYFIRCLKNVVNDLYLEASDKFEYIKMFRRQSVPVGITRNMKPLQLMMQGFNSILGFIKVMPVKVLTLTYTASVFLLAPFHLPH